MSKGRYNANGPTSTTGAQIELPIRVDANGFQYVVLKDIETISDLPNGVMVVEQGQFGYETVAASQTDQVLGGVGAIGDLLHQLIITVGTAATAAVSIKDGGGSSIPILPNSPGGGIGVYVVEFNVASAAGAWKVTTGGGSTVMAIGRFSA